MTDRRTASTINDTELDALYDQRDRAEAALTRARDAARLHRQGLLSLTELYAVIGPALDTPEHAP